MVTAGSNIKHFNRRNTGNDSDCDTDETTILNFIYTLKCEFKMSRYKECIWELCAL
jgi:hypothetical protein